MGDAKGKKTKDAAGTETPAHRYRSHTCGALRHTDIGKTVRLSGWVHRVRDHGGLLFIDLRDHYGITQVVADPDSPAFKAAESVRSEWVIRVDGAVRKRPEGTVNAEVCVSFLDCMVAGMDRQIILALDQHRIHRAKFVTEKVIALNGRLEIVFFARLLAAAQPPTKACGRA